MKKLIIVLILTISIIGIGSCKKDISPASAASALDLQAVDTLYAIMNQYYFWYNYMPVIVKSDYKDPYSLLDAMLYKTLDRWSFMETYNEYLAESTGSFVGHGISLGLDPGGQVRIAEIYKNSPLYISGVRRGWIVIKLNGTDLAPIFVARDGSAYSTLIGPSTAGVINTFLFHTPAGRDTTITSTKAAFTLNTVITADTLHLKSGIAGHLVFDQFIPPSNAELQNAFAYFSQFNIRDLIVDLRYNGGGDLSVLTNMASYIAGAAKFNSTFLTLTFNDKNLALNEIFSFKSVTTPLNISRMVVITTRGTASASEDFINGLKPGIDVKTVGDTTNGKPVGMVGFGFPQISPTYVFWPISFSLVNSVGQGEFYNGFAPNKLAPDDITHDWSDRNESCLKESIYYLEHGVVSTKSLDVSAAPYRRSVTFSEKPGKNNNAYIINK